jgi:hypothetical protein
LCQIEFSKEVLNGEFNGMKPVADLGTLGLKNEWEPLLRKASSVLLFSARLKLSGYARPQHSASAGQVRLNPCG